MLWNSWQDMALRLESNDSVNGNVVFFIALAAIYRSAAATCAAVCIEILLLTWSPITDQLCFLRAACYQPSHVKKEIYENKKCHGFLLHKLYHSWRSTNISAAYM
jgi:hypothetical protein